MKYTSSVKLHLQGHVEAKAQAHVARVRTDVRYSAYSSKITVK